MPVTDQNQPQAITVPGSSGMIRIGRSPAAKRLPLTLAVGIPASLVLAIPTSAPFGDAAWRYPLTLACWLALLPGGLLLFLALWYRPVAFDPQTGMARLGRKVVPLATVTTARREVSIGAYNAIHLSYRFTSTDGAWGRVLVAGSRMRGLDAEGLRQLERFVEASGIRDPADADGLDPAQRNVADQLSALHEHSTKSVVGKGVILAELRGEPPPGGTPGEARPPTPEQWERDDRDAEAYLADQREVGRYARRVFRLLTVAAAIAGFAALIVAAIMEETSVGGRLDTDSNDLVAAAVGGAIAVGLLSYLGYCVAVFLDIRHAQRVSLAWLRGRDAGQVERGLPLPLLAPFLDTTPGHKLKLLATFTAGPVGALGLIAAPVIHFTASAEDAGSDAPPPAVAAVALVVGVVATALAVALYVSANRGKRRQHTFAARVGRRLYEGPGDFDDPGGHPAEYPAGPDPESRPAGSPGSATPAL